jgi:glucosamine-6-phosphate deaminase
MFHNIHLFVEPDYDAMSRKAAGIFLEAFNAKPDGVYGFATGGTPVGMYKELINAAPDVSRMTAFNLDEYYPIKPEDPQSYYYFMRENLFDALNLPPGQTNIPNGLASDPAAECTAYEEKILQAGGIDLQILGIGNNGHIGFNEPSEAFTAQTNYVPLTEITIQANARFFESADDVPKHALTMGIRSIMLARRILLLCSGGGKASILRDSLKGPITPLVPASVLQMHPDVTVIADSAATSLL